MNKFDEGPDKLVPLFPGRVPDLLVLLLHEASDPSVVGMPGVVLVEPAVRSGTIADMESIFLY